jgi:hypothetical protein
VVNIFSYVVEHDNGEAPNPYFDFCTLCRCKFREKAEDARGRKLPRNIVELAKVGDWVIGTGGASKKRSVGRHGTLVYAMRVDEKPTRKDYFSDSRFAEKKRVDAGTYEQTRGDNERPRNDFERVEQFALVSQHFYYFGASAKSATNIPKRFKCLEKTGPGFRYVDPENFRPFREWLEKHYEPGKQGEPCYQELPKGAKRCKSSC